MNKLDRILEITIGIMMYAVLYIFATYVCALPIMAYYKGMIDSTMAIAFQIPLTILYIGVLKTIKNIKI